MTVVPLGPGAGATVVTAIKQAHVTCLLSDRDINGGGVEVEFFGERTTLPGGPATLALRTGAALLPDGRVLPGQGPPRRRSGRRFPLNAEGGCATTSQRVTQVLAYELEALIRAEPGAVAPAAAQLAQRPRSPRRGPRLASSRSCASACCAPTASPIPGGVQGQVLGLARALRRRGHEARVLGPCDGPPPDAFVTPLGKSVPTAANGSVAPLAPDPAAQLRTMRALRDEDFDVLHLHEPFAPGPCMTALMIKPAPDHRHVPRGRRELRLQAHGGRDALPQPPPRPALCRVRGRPGARLQRGLGGAFDLLFNGVELDRLPGRLSRGPPSGPDHLLLRPPRAPQGPRRAAGGDGRPPRRRAPVGGQ